MSGTCQAQFAWLEPSTFDYYDLGRFDTKIGGHHPGSYSGTKAPTNKQAPWYEASTGGQKSNNYDQFLRSNIDNEQDNRDFRYDYGRDHLPFRTFEGEIRTDGYSDMVKGKGYLGVQNLWATVPPGDSRIVPMYWNNPHASELEVNIWIQDHSAGKPIVVPIKKPSCSGEGYQSNVIKFTVPDDFSDLGSKIPGFKGCNEDSKPMCTVQIYAHSVESRQYASAFPIVIPGHKPGRTTSSRAIEPAKTDPWLDLGQLRELCRPSNDADVDIKRAVPRWARLVSDVYNHAFQNSDFSPYSGQQHESISQNLQASAINKMVTGNRGELGKAALNGEQRTRINQLQALEDRIYKNYEALANKIINKVGNQMRTTEVFDTSMKQYDASGKISTKPCVVAYEDCFRCAEVGSLRTSRLQTNTYIPSYQLRPNLVAQARSLVPQKYGDLITSTGQVRIYVQSMLDLLPFFAVSHPYGIIYQQAKIKNTMVTMPTPTMFRKVNLDVERTEFRVGDHRRLKIDSGEYASFAMKKEEAKSLGCPWACLHACGNSNAICTKGEAPALLPTYFSKGYGYGGRESYRVSRRGNWTKLSGECAPCRALIDGFRDSKDIQPVLTTLAKSIIKEGLPGGFTGVASYPDVDGSPRIGVPFPNGTKVKPEGQPDWGEQIKKTMRPTPPPASAPESTPAPTSAPTAPPDQGACQKLSMCIDQCPMNKAKFQMCVRKCQGKPPPEPDAKPPSRRRRSGGSRRRRRRSGGSPEPDVKPPSRRRRRRRRRPSFQELFAEVLSQHEQS